MRLLFRNSSFSREWRISKFWLVASALAALVVVCFASSVCAVDPDRTISQYLREHWGSDRGLSGGAVTAIAQTPDGYLWVGTEKGLFRFDGLTFRAFPLAVPTTFAIGPVQRLVSDSQGNLWILLKNTTILRYHDQKFELGREEAEAGITSIFKRRDGTVLLSSLALGALTYQTGKFDVLTSPTEAAHPKSAIAAPANDQQSSRLSWATGVAPHRYAEPNSAVISMAETSDGRVWLGTEDKGLFYLTQGRVFPAGKEGPKTEIHSLLAFENGDLWIGTDNGVMRWNGTAVTSERVPLLLRQAHVLCMLRDRDSNIWLGTANRLLRVSPDGASVEQDASQTTRQVTALFEDREGDIWVGSSLGLDRLRDSAFVTYSVAGLQSESSGPVYVDQDERTWFAPFEGGLHWLKGETAGSVANDGLARDVVYSIAGNKDELWIGRQEGGLTQLRYVDGAFKAKTYTESDGLAQNSVYAVYPSRDGTVWAGTLSGGVSELRNGHFKTYTFSNGISSNTVASIAETPDGTMWFATPNGVSSLRDGHWRVFGTSEGLPSADVNCLATDSSGVLWIGTAAGPAWFDAGRIRSPSEVPADLHEQILGIADDHKGRLWIATSGHVLRVNREKLLGGSLSSADVHEYGVSDGLHGTEGVKRQQSVFADPLGRIWFSMNRGISVVDPIRASTDSVPVFTQIQAVSGDGVAMNLNGPVRLPSGRQRITFSYAGLSLSVPERVHYRYRLYGFDRGWSDPVTSREAVYMNLSPGSYRFRVIASNSEGIWNDPGATLDFSVTPAWFQTTWFRVLCVVAVLSLAWFFYRLRVRQIAKAISTRFDERLAERTRMARDLHDTFLQTVQGSKLVADDALDDSSDPVRMRHAMEQLSNWLGQATQEGRAALNSLRTSTTERNDLAEAFKRATENGFVPASMAVTFSVLGTSREMHPIVRDEIYRMGYEAIRNACTHSKASRLEVELRYAQDLALRVSDNGVGIDPDVADRGKHGHFGLQGMRERAARIGGKLTLVSSASSGTEITVVVPGRIVFRKATETRFERIRAIVKGIGRTDPD